MGLTAPSLYNAFGDKQQLFSRDLERYLERTTRDRLRRLEQSFAPREALSRFFGEIIEHSINDRHRKGCFLANSALEVAPHDAECRAVIAAQFRDIEAFFRRCILAAQADKTVSTDIDAGNTARLLPGVLLGIRVLARTSSDRDVLARAYSTSESFAERAAARRNNPTTIISAIKLPVNVSRAASASGFWLSGKSFDRRSDGSRRAEIACDSTSSAWRPRWITPSDTRRAQAA
jgi:TetR/AcrR family transcriptional regulator, transcriptional repressor for nem operon